MNGNIVIENSDGSKNFISGRWFDTMKEVYAEIKKVKNGDSIFEQIPKKVYWEND